MVSKVTVTATTGSLPADDRKSAPVFVVDVECNGKASTVRHRFSEFEKLYERTKQLLSSDIGSPPKKRIFGGSEAKLIERRRVWLKLFVEQLLLSVAASAATRDFLSIDGSFWTNADSTDGDENASNSNVDLGPSERITAKPSDFEFLKTVGKGSFGRVYLARHKADQQIFAMKVLSKAHIKKRNEVKHVMSERNVLILNMKHPFLVSLHYSFQTKDKLYFVLDYLNGGELFFHLQREKRFAEPRARFYTAEIASALGYLHEKDIIYRDLKPENLLLDRYGHVVLTDFGLCKEGITATDTTGTFCGTPEYLAPEIVLKKPYDRTVDWWCLGSVLYEMLFGLPPFYSKDHNEMYDKIVHQQLRISQMVSMSARDALSQLLQKDRSIRLGAKRDFAEVKEHAFFYAIDWAALLRREIKPPFVPRVKDELDISCIDKEFTEQPVTDSLIPKSHQAFHAGTTIENDFHGFSYVPQAEIA
jgi:serine/threonine protein kinase